MTPTYVVTAGTHDSEVFDPLVLHESIITACLAVRAYEGMAHTIAERVVRHVIDWSTGKNEVTNDDIRRTASKYLSIYHPEASYLYKQYRLIA